MFEKEFWLHVLYMVLACLFVIGGSYLCRNLPLDW